MNTNQYIETIVPRASQTLLAMLEKKPINRVYLNSILAFRNQYFSFDKAIETYKRQVRYDKRCERREKLTPQKRCLKLDSLRGRLVSVEIECYPRWRERSGALSDWSGALSDWIPDSSLDDGGRELRNISWIENGRIGGILRLSNILKNCTVNKRCGLHVHVDVRDLSVEKQAVVYDRLTKLYSFLKKLVPPSRLRNSYCEWVNNREDSADYVRPRRGERYAAINWSSVAEHGTIEFRCAAGSVNPVKIESWALVCVRLVEWAKNDYNSIPKNWKQFLTIFPEPLRSWVELRRVALAARQEMYIDFNNERILSAAQ